MGYESEETELGSGECFENFILCYNEDCILSDRCAHFFKKHGVKDGGYIRYIGSGTNQPCRNFEEEK